MGRGPDGARPPFPGGPILAALDTNHNGRLESDEIDQAIVVLRRMDRNHDGDLTPEEIGPMGPPHGDRPPHDDRRPPEGGRPPGDGPPLDRRRGDDSPPPREGADRSRSADRNSGGPPSPDDLRQRFREADENKDGKLSKEEAPERLKFSFDRLDLDGSGFLEQSELREIISRMELSRPDAPRDGGPDRRPSRDGDQPR